MGAGSISSRNTAKYTILRQFKVQGFSPKMILSDKQHIFIENMRQIDSLFTTSLVVVPLINSFYLIMGCQFINTDLYLALILELFKLRFNLP